MGEPIYLGRGRSDSEPIGAGGMSCDSTGRDTVRMEGQDSPGGGRHGFGFSSLCVTGLANPRTNTVVPESSKVLV